MQVKLMRFLDEVASKKTSSLGCGWNANESKLKVIFFILLLLLIAAGSVQINVATTTCKNVETLPQKNHLSCFKSLLVSIYIIL